MSEAAPHGDEGTLLGRHGRRLRWRGWSPAGDQPARAVVTIAHGFGEHGGRYAEVAARLNQAGYVVYAPDHHGHGRSAGRRGRIVLADAVADLDLFLQSVAVERNPGSAQFLLGHSMGGALALRYAIAHQRRLSGMVLSAPLAELESGAALRSLARALGLVAPWLPVSRIDPQLVSRDATVVQAYVDDPLNHHGAISAAVAREFVCHVQTLAEDVRQLTLPTLLLWGTEDRLCPPRGAQMLAERIGAEDLSTDAYEGLFHELLNEPEREQVMRRIVAWLDRRTTGVADGER